ncbi:YwqG family protein [Paenibacillus sp. YYML68]|uniref:YwqG family protein n=1 Tax=Paenibacillus sp. YYML68 TaxID=2909250 RepID=UPI00249181CE|nr:YwqG family protein [Paenibacillus sp. YYML68]
MMKDQSVIQLVQSSGLNRIESLLISLTLESIRLWTDVEREEIIPIGSSKLGGKPDLPINHEWPQNQGGFLQFIAQINLGQIASLETTMLPSEGLLSFFYDALEQPWGFDPKDKGSWKVLYFQDMNEFERKVEPFEIQEEGSFGTARISFETQTSVPSSESMSVERLELSQDDCDRYWELYDKIQEHNRSNGITHKLLGHPDNIQGDMQLECQLVSNGLYCGDSSGYGDPRRTWLEHGAASWRLLLQVDSEDEIGMMWGDAGRLYFWIREEDLRERNFDNVWVILQCG